MKPAIRFSALTIAICSVVGLTGCKLSDLIDSDESSKFVALQGTAATTNGPMAGARVDIKDANGEEFSVYVNSSGYFSLSQDPEDEDDEYIELQSPLVLRVDYDSQTYHSVLCNIVYSEFGDAIDTVNIHSLTEFVMAKTAEDSGIVSRNDYVGWTAGASDTYCNNEFFVTNYNNIASSLDGNGTFNFFNTLFSVDEKGFDAILRNFDPGMAINDAPEGFHLTNGLGSLNLLPGTSWTGTASGKFGSTVVDVSDTGIQLSITPEGLADALEDLLGEAADSEIELQSLSISAEGNGIGEIGTTAKIRLKGSAALVGASVVSRDFDVTLDLVRVAGGLVAGPI